MTIKDKVQQYLFTHKAPITMQGLADRFMVSITGIRNALIELEEDNLARCEKIGVRQYWSAVYARPVAVSVPVDPGKPVAARQTSYPHIRGYDD